MTDYAFLNREFDKFADAMDRQLKLMLTSGNPIVKIGGGRITFLPLP